MVILNSSMQVDNEVRTDWQRRITSPKKGTQMNQESIQIEPEFEQFIPPLLPEELKQLEENMDAKFLLENGNRVMIKRKRFEEYLNDASVI